MKKESAFKAAIVGVALCFSTADAIPLFSASDGGGRATVEPRGRFVARSAGTWKIVYTAGKEGIAPGGGIVLQVSPFWGWTPPQVENPSLPGYVTAEVARGDARLELFKSVPYSVVIQVAEGRLKRGDSVVITYGDTGGGANPGAAARIDRYSEREAPLHIKVDGDGDGSYREIEQSPEIDITAGPPAKISVVATSVVPAGDEGVLVLAVLDAANNWVEEYRGELLLSCEPPGLDLAEACSFGRGDEGSKRVPFRAGPCGRYIVKAVDGARGLEGSSNPVEVVSSQPARRLYWADPHGHSGLSDGTGTPEDYYRYARDVAGLDISALTDHDAWGIRPLDENPSLWRRIQNVTNGVYRPGRFVTFVGYEWTSWTYGHMHVLFRGKRGSLHSYRSPESDTPEKLWSLLPRGGAITIPHHPGGGPVPADWSVYKPSFEPLVEICSVHGVSERPEAPLAIYHPVQGAFVRDALRRGYKMGFLGGGDSHTGHPGIPYADAPAFGLSGVYADELTREGIWSAFLARRTYATTGDRIILRFDVNGTEMGGEVKAATPLRISAEAVPCGPVKSFDVLFNGNVIHSVDGERIDYTYPKACRPGDYFYVRLLQENGQQAFSSPVWIK